MNVKRLARRTLARGIVKYVGDKSKFLVIDLSRSKITLEEAATLAFNARDIQSRYNKERDLLIFEFETAQEKLSYMKRLPQWVWNRGCVILEYSNDDLEQWVLETVG